MLLPISRATRESNRREREVPSLAWARTRRFGEELNNALRRHLVAWLGERGGAAVAPLLAPDWQRFNDIPCEYRIPRRPGRRASRAPRVRIPPAGSSPARTPRAEGPRRRAT